MFYPSTYIWHQRDTHQPGAAWLLVESFGLVRQSLGQKKPYPYRIQDATVLILQEGGTIIHYKNVQIPPTTFGREKILMPLFFGRHP